MPLGKLFTITPSILKSDSDEAYTVGLGLKVQLDSATPPVVDGELIEGLQVPIPGCTDFALPGTIFLLDPILYVGGKVSIFSPVSQKNP